MDAVIDKKGHILIATGIAFMVAALIIVTLILPAEFDIDPLGTGQLLGLKGLSADASKTVVMEQAKYQEDSVSFLLQPFESVEYKYQLHKGSSLLFSWVATNILTVEFHGEPEGGPEGFAETYSVGKAKLENGTFTAPFNGIHGWFWENRGSEAVTVVLTSSGFYSATLTFREGSIEKQVLSDKVVLAP
ncbi:MAG: hypothetical protein ACI9CE_003660 [Flavobacterium sp.]|jgi:hypothetical protein